MKTSVKILIPLVVIAVFAACSDLFNRGNNGPELTLNTSKAGETVVFNGDTLVFETYGIGFGDTLDIQDLPPFQYRTEDQNIVINGYYYALGIVPEGVIIQEGDTITIKVGPPKEPRPSTSLPTGVLYNAYIRNIRPGNYTVQIIHKEDGLYYNHHNPMKTFDDTVFTKEIVVE